MDGFRLKNWPTYKFSKIKVKMENFKSKRMWSDRLENEGKNDWRISEDNKISSKSKYFYYGPEPGGFI